MDDMDLVTMAMANGKSSSQMEFNIFKCSPSLSRRMVERRYGEGYSAGSPNRGWSKCV
jgi:hypothetical protein